MESLENENIYSHPVWQQIETYRNCKSYLDYLRKQRKVVSRHANILRHWTLSTIPLFDFQQKVRGSCSILDLSVAGRLERRLSYSSFLRPQYASRILEVLLDASKDICVRILLLDLGEKQPDEIWSTAGPLLDAVGLALKLDPKVFDAFLENSEVGRQISLRGCYGATHCIIGRCVFAISRDYLPAERHCPPVILILDNPIRHRNILELSTSLSLDEDEAENLPLTSSWPGIYETLLKRHLRQSPGIISGRMIGFQVIMSPIIRVHLENIRDRISADQKSFSDLTRGGAGAVPDPNSEKILEELRSDLRERNLGWCKSIRDYKRYSKIQGIGMLQTDLPCSLIEDDLKACQEDMDNLEISIKDWLQIRYGSLALDESKRSIELSDLQAKESKRVKIFTVLAFFYVPLNLATSIFGMNLQQLNDQGQHVGTFIGTALIALILTGLIWFLVDLHRTDIHIPEIKLDGTIHRGEGRLQRPQKKKKVGFMRRIRLLTYLASNADRRKWMRNTNAWLCILTNDSLGRVYFSEAEPYIAEPEVKEFNSMTVAEYVSLYAYQTRNWFDSRYFFAARWTRPKEIEAKYPDIIEHELQETTRRASSNYLEETP